MHGVAFTVDAVPIPDHFVRDNYLRSPDTELAPELGNESCSIGFSQDERIVAQSIEGAATHSEDSNLQSEPYPNGVLEEDEWNGVGSDNKTATTSQVTQGDYESDEDSENHLPILWRKIHKWVEQETENRQTMFQYAEFLKKVGAKTPGQRLTNVSITSHIRFGDRRAKGSKASAQSSGS